MVPPPAPEHLHIDSSLLPLSRREMQVLAEAVKAAPGYADLLMHMLNQREAVDSSQIEGTHTQFDELLLHELEIGMPGAVADADAEQTLNYLYAYMLGTTQVREKGSRALDIRLICTLHEKLMKGESRARPGEFRNIQNFIGGMKMEHALLIGQPVVTVNALVERLQVTFTSANTAVATLVDMEILRPHGQQRRDRAFQAHEVVDVLYTGIDKILEDVAALQNYRDAGRK